MVRARRKHVPAVASSERIPLAGQIVAVTSEGVARFVSAEGVEIPCRCPQHVSVSWLRAAVARAPVAAEIAASADRRAGSVWCLFPAPVHDDVAAESIELRASRQVKLVCGEVTLTMTREGKARLRAREASVRGSRIARLTGGIVKIN